MYGYSLNIKQYKINKLKGILPEVVSEGKIDYKKLKDILGDNLNVKD